MLEGAMEDWKMRFAFAVAACVIYAAASLLSAPAEAAVDVAHGMAAPAPSITRVQSSGAAKIRKECEVKADKLKLKGLSHDAYVDRCIDALSFNTQYGTR
jgi:hypothetical protein